MLDKGENSRIEMTVNKNDLRVWDSQAKKFIIPKGIYTFMIGTSSDDIRLTTQIDL